MFSVCVCVFLRFLCFKILIERWFWEIIVLIGSLVELHVGLHSCLCFSPLEKMVLKSGLKPPRHLTICRASYAFISQSQQLLDTCWINRESSCLLDSFSTPGGSIELLFLELVNCSLILARYLSYRQGLSWHLSR